MSYPKGGKSRACVSDCEGQEMSIKPRSALIALALLSLTWEMLAAAADHG